MSRREHRKVISLFVILIVVLTCLVFYPLQTESKAQYVMPILGGMKMSLPYDLGNIFIRPIAGAVSVFLSISLLCILFFGMVTAPFGYMLGIPSRKYVLGGPTDPLHSQTAKRSLDFDFLDKLNINDERFEKETLDQTSSKIIPSFEDQVFYLLPTPIQNDSDCKLLTLCHAHNSISRLPPTALKIFRSFSEKLIQLSPSQTKAIKIGLKNEEYCGDIYTTCKDSVYTIVLKSFLGLLPDFMKNHTHRRKKAMYAKKNSFADLF